MCTFDHRARDDSGHHRYVQLCRDVKGPEPETVNPTIREPTSFGEESDGRGVLDPAP